MAAIPFVTVYVPDKGFISLSLNTGGLNWETCTIHRVGSLVFGALHPVFLAVPVSGVPPARCDSALLLELGSVFTIFRIRISKPMFYNFAPNCAHITWV